MNQAGQQARLATQPQTPCSHNVDHIYDPVNVVSYTTSSSLEQDTLGLCAVRQLDISNDKHPDQRKGHNASAGNQHLALRISVSKSNGLARG